VIERVGGSSTRPASRGRGSGDFVSVFVGSVEPGDQRPPLALACGLRSHRTAWRLNQKITREPASLQLLGAQITLLNDHVRLGFPRARRASGGGSAARSVASTAMRRQAAGEASLDVAAR